LSTAAVIVPCALRVGVYNLGAPEKPMASEVCAAQAATKSLYFLKFVGNLTFRWEFPGSTKALAGVCPVFRVRPATKCGGPKLNAKQKRVVAGMVAVFGLVVAGVTVFSRGVASVSAAPPADQGMRTEKVNDPANNETAFTVQVPAGWSFVGTILRPGGCHAPQVPADGLSYSMVAPDHVTAIMQVPGSHWAWQSDGTNPEGPKCKPIDITGATAFLLNIAIPNMHPTAKILGIVPLTPQMQQGLEQERRNIAANPNLAHNTIDTGRVRIEYELNGQTVDEQLGTVVTCFNSHFPAYPALRRPATDKRICGAHGIYVKRALKGHLDELVARNVPNAQMDKEWDAHIAEKMRQAFAQFQKASDEQFQAIQKHYQEVTAGMLQRGKEFNDNLVATAQDAMRADSGQVGAMQHAAHLQVLDSLNRADFIDPQTGMKIETSNQYDHNWISSDRSEVVLNNDPTYDPNGQVDPVRQSWTELIPAN
jgi:hypothetical protein